MEPPQPEIRKYPLETTEAKVTVLPTENQSASSGVPLTASISNHNATALQPPTNGSVSTSESKSTTSTSSTSDNLPSYATILPPTPTDSASSGPKTL